METYTDLKNWRYGQEEDLCRVRVYFKEKGNKLDWQSSYIGLIYRDLYGINGHR